MKTKNKDKKRHKDRCSFDIEGEERKCDTLMLNDSDAHYHLINERQNLHVSVCGQHVMANFVPPKHQKSQLNL